MHSLSGVPPKLPPPARQNGPSLIGRQKVRLVISFGPKVQGTLPHFLGPKRTVHVARFEGRGPWTLVLGPLCLIGKNRLGPLSLALRT